MAWCSTKDKANDGSGGSEFNRSKDVVLGEELVLARRKFDPALCCVRPAVVGPLPVPLLVVVERRASSTLDRVGLVDRGRYSTAMISVGI